MTLRESIGGREVAISFPAHLAAHMLPLLISERLELEALFGARVRFVEAVPDMGPRWIVAHHPDVAANSLAWDAATVTLTSTVRNAAGLGTTLQMVHSLVTQGRERISDDEVDDLPMAVARIERELERGFPGFGIRNMSWAGVRSLFPDSNHMSLDDLQELVAMLQDGHTAVRPNVPIYNPPYALALQPDGSANLLRVPAWSDAAKAGIGVGWKVQLDDHHWMKRSGSPPHSLPMVAARRAIALNGVVSRDFTARGPNGELRTWREHARAFTVQELLSHCVVARDTVLVRMHNWITGVGMEERFDQILHDHRDKVRLVLDLRSNTGGNLLMAQQFRRKFLRERTLCGTIRFTRADGTLSEHAQIWADPAEGVRWSGDLIVLTDPLTYSASEDFLHGLQGFPHVTVVGAPSGGGSGRPRTLPVIPGWTISISTALTYDRNGHCIEGQGIPVDIAVDPFTEAWRAVLGLPSD